MAAPVSAPPWAEAGSAGTALLRHAGTRLLDLFLPPQCLGCGALTDDPGSLCTECWRPIRFLGPPCCRICGYPFEFDAGGDALCAACSRRAPAYDRARAVMAYDDASRGLVLTFKHGDRTDAAPAFARWMLRAGRELAAEADLIVPVPLHPMRLFRRRFNQAALLAQEIARLAGRMSVPDLLVRRRNTPSQGRLSPAARRRNLAGAFAVRPRYREAGCAGRRVLLIDDVLTTGTTVEACARVLRRAGAGGVDVLTLQRVVRAAT